jgi:putative nucleotidyltransferase with HDIG domain
MTQSPNNSIGRVIREIEHLPTLPQVVTKLLTMADSTKVNAIDLSKEMDQSLSAKVLKVANSAYYGVRKVNSVRQAIVTIGFDSLKEIILTTSFFHTFQDSQEVEALKPLWQHSLECAFVAKRLAWVYRYEAMDEAYLAGLIHDIGKLVVHQYFPDQLRIIKSKNDGGIEDLKAEKEVLGLTHAQIAGEMAKQWNFPEALVEAIAHHHDEKWELNPTLGRILFFADRFVSGLVDFHRMLELFTQAGMRFPLNWHLDELKRVEEIFREEMKKAASLLDNPPAAP